MLMFSEDEVMERMSSTDFKNSYFEFTKGRDNVFNLDDLLFF